MKTSPKLKEIYEGLENDFRSNLGLNNDQLKKVFSAMASVLAAQLKLIYLRQDDVQKNLFPDTADVIEEGGELNRIGQIRLKRQPFPATDGYYKVEVFGVEGSILRNGLTFKSNDDALNAGLLFINDSNYELINGQNFITIRSLESGIKSSLMVGNQLTITEPVIGVEGTVNVTEIIALPIEKETVKAYRNAVVESYYLEPQGGSKTDYRVWTREVQGVQNVFPYVKQNDAGTVQVFVEATKIDSTDGKGTPNAFTLQNVENSIEASQTRARRPIQAVIEVLSITPVAIDIEIYNLQQSPQSVKDKIKENVDLYLETVRPFVAGADLLRNKNDILNSGKLQNVIQESLENSNFFTDFKMFVDNDEKISNVFSFSNIPYLRTISYL